MVVGRGFRRRCPRCGVGKTTAGFRIRDKCGECGLVFEGKGGDQFGIMYLTTAVVTIAFFAFLITVHPKMGWPERLLFVGIGVSIMAVTLPLRKSIAIAIDYWGDHT